MQKKIALVLSTVLIASSLLAACSPAPTATQPQAPTPTLSAAGATAQAGGQEALRSRWHTPVTAAVYPWLVCQSALANISGEESGAEREQAAVSVAQLANAGLEVLAQWEPPEDFAENRSQSLAHLTVLIETAGRWYQEETDGPAFMNELGELCRSVDTSLQATTAAARAEGLTQETLEAIVTQFQQSIGQ